MPLAESRRLFRSIGMSLALQGVALVAMVPVVSGRAEAASPASANESPMHAAPAKPVKIVPVSADLSRDLDRLETRGAGARSLTSFPHPLVLLLGRRGRREGSASPLHRRPKVRRMRSR